MNKVDVELNFTSINGSLAEWLRRKTRNLLGYSRVGSSPATVEIIFVLHL